MAREASFNFIPIKQAINHDVELLVSINLTQNRLYFLKKCPESKYLIGKYLKFFVDKDKKTLAWSLVEGGLSDLSGAKKVTQNPAGIGVLVPQLAQALGLPNVGTYQKLTVKTYRTQGLLDATKYNYVELRKEKYKHSTRKPKGNI